jgi:hypothetical protein
MWNSALDIFDQPSQSVPTVLCNVTYSKSLEYETRIPGNEMASPVPKQS